MTGQSKILVTGATGNVGREVVSQLLDTGAAVRALVREPDSANLPDEVEVVRGDLSEPDTLDARLEGVKSVYLSADAEEPDSFWAASSAWSSSPDWRGPSCGQPGSPPTL